MEQIVERSRRVPLLVRAVRRQAVERTPIWLMRQAGRILPEYRAIREKWSLLDIAQQPELAVQVTLQPLARFPLDAAILFSDIMTPLHASGVALEIVEGVGPVIASPIRSARDVQRLRGLEPESDVPFVLQALRLLRRELDPDVALIGFAGAPFTLASYLIEGRPTRTFARTKALMLGEPALWSELMERLTNLTIAYLTSQIRAGADVVQLFDSWIGALAPDDYARYVAPYTRRIFAALSAEGDAPAIHFGVGTAMLLDIMREDGASVIGLDWRVPLDEGWARVGYDLAIQGNLDPAVLCASHSVIEERSLDVLARAGGRPGHIFNLGHGVLPETPLDNVAHLVRLVREVSAQIAPMHAALG